MGYSTEHKGYRCYDPSSRRIRISRDVRFVENRPFFYTPITHSTYSPIESTSFLSLPSPSTSVTNLSPQSSVPIPSIHISPPETSLDLLAPPPKPPIIHVYTRRPTPQTQATPIAHSPASPDTTVFDDTNNSDELQVNRPYHLRDHSTIPPIDRFGYPRIGSVITEPSNYQEIAGIPEWQHAMTEELAALDHTGTWDIVPLPSHAVPITCKWVFKVKTKSDGSIERYKAHLVARGFQQTQGRDYNETFAPVANMTTV